MKLVTAHEIKLMTNTEGLVLQGCGGNLADWVSGINGLLTEEGILLDGDIFKDIYLFEQENVTNILFCMDDVKLDVAKLAIWRIANHDKFGGTWLSDYIPNRLQAVKPEPIFKESDSQTVGTRPESHIKVESTDLTVLLAKIHVTAGEYAADIIHNLNTLEAKRSAEYLMLISDDKIFLTESAHAYRHGTTAFDAIQNAEETPASRVFALHVSDMHKEHVVGDIVEVNRRELQLDILHHSIHPIRIDATAKSETTVSFSPEEWEKQQPIDRDHLKIWTRKFDPADIQAVIQHLEEVSGNHVHSGKTVAPDALISNLNTAYMDKSENAQPDMLRIDLRTAKEMLSHGDAPVYRLLPEGGKELSALDAMQSRGGLWFQAYREFAIKKEDSSGLDKWANRTADEAVKRVQQRSEQEKSKTKEPEL